MPHAVATFENDSYEEEPYDAGEGSTLGRVHITRSFEGDFTGKSTAELLTATTDAGSGAYVGIDRITGRLGDREGSFVLQHHGLISSAGSSTAATIVPDSGTGELAGLSGEGSIVVGESGEHRLELDYELG
jgi:hypothetical protein